MKRNLPAPTVRFLVGKACVLMPSFVKELVRTIRQIAPGECGDRVNHLPKLGLGLLDLVKRSFKRFLCPLSIFDVGAGCVPAYELSVFVQQWAVADQEPPVFTVFPK